MFSNRDPKRQQTELPPDFFRKAFPEESEHLDHAQLWGIASGYNRNPEHLLHLEGCQQCQSMLQVVVMG